MSSGQINLLIDSGNSFCKVATAEGGVFSPITIFPTLTAEILAPYFANCSRRVAAIYSKVGNADSQVVDYLQGRVAYFEMLSSQTPVPLTEIRYDRKKLGSDRLALVVGGVSLFPNRPLLVVDIGTAITYDFVDESGVYLGGDIAPGPRTRSKSLASATALLPDVDFMQASQSDTSVATTTEEAIANGITRGIVSEIESYIARAKCIAPLATTIITGGYGSFFANQIKSKTFVVPNLLMVGLNQILEYNDPR